MGIIARILLALICTAMSFSILGRARKNRVFGKAAGQVSATWKRFLCYAGEAAEKRIKEEERLQREEGNRDRKNPFYRMDEMLIHAGIRKRFPSLTVELLILLLATVTLTVLIISSEMTGSLLLGMAVVGFLLMGLTMGIKLLIRMRQRKVEDSILHFANLLENYARTSDDIVMIFHKISVYLEEPLQSAVEECYIEAYTTGDFATACNHLDISIGNRYLSDMLANIEICSRHRANYEEVIHGNKEIVRKYLSERDVRREMTKSARIEIGIMMLIAFWTVNILDGMFPNGLLEILLGSSLGKVLLAGLILIALFAAHEMLSIGEEEG